RRRHTRLQGDWSSDVCSSDLGKQSEAGTARERADGKAQAPPKVREFRRSPRIADLFAISTYSAEFALRREPGFAFGHAFVAVLEIGRASCRERGWLWGVVGAL